MKDIQCSCGSDNVGIFPCAGAANVGQLSNKAALYLTRHGAGTMMCTAGIGAHQQGITRSAQGCDIIVVIDGCQLACAKESLEHAGIQVHKHIVLSELGIKKSKDLDMKPTEVKDIMEQVKALLQ
ncbi:MAG: putative zinc-binding protein [ANME-2 cluster archaeon]|nr:putative zinc-binding protein [ANME-2 cluster archaeon]